MSQFNPTRRGLFGLLAVAPFTPLLVRGAAAAPLTAGGNIIRGGPIVTGTVTAERTITAPQIPARAITADLMAYQPPRNGVPA